MLRSFAAFLCLYSTCFAQHTPRPCADTPIKTTAGKTIHIPQYHDKVVMIVTFITTDDPCLHLLQELSKFQKDMAPRGLQIVGISIDDTAANVTPFAERYHFSFPIGHLDRLEANKLADLNQNAHASLPYIMFVDWQGNVRFQYPGNHPIFSSGPQGIEGIANGLLRQAAEKKGPQFSK
jgi:peroxiredoxin